VKHADKVLELYDDEKHYHLANILNHDPKTLAGAHASICTWVLGYPDRASRLSIEKDVHARRRGHPFDLAFALMTGTHEFDHRWKLIDELIFQIEHPGWEERFSYAEILRLKGWMLSLKGDLEGAERNFLTSLDWAPPAGENVGVAHLDQPRSALAEPRQAPRGV
jgi:hypothetical protein